MNLRQIVSVVAIAGIAATSCNNAANREREAAYKAQQEELESIKYEMAKQRVVDSMNAVAKVEQEQKQQKVTSTTTTRSSSPRRSYAGEERVYVHTASQPAPVQTVYQPAPEPEKKGWSAKAKGALIGAGVGAATGAVIHKKSRGTGAVVGGILGAGAGLGTGAIIDKKNGR